MCEDTQNTKRNMMNTPKKMPAVVNQVSMKHDATAARLFLVTTDEEMVDEVNKLMQYTGGLEQQIIYQERILEITNNTLAEAQNKVDISFSRIVHLEQKLRSSEIEVLRLKSILMKAQMEEEVFSNQDVALLENKFAIHSIK